MTNDNKLLLLNVVIPAFHDNPLAFVVMSARSFRLAIVLYGTRHLSKSSRPLPWRALGKIRSSCWLRQKACVVVNEAVPL